MPALHWWGIKGCIMLLCVTVSLLDGAARRNTHDCWALTLNSHKRRRLVPCIRRSSVDVVDRWLTVVRVTATQSSPGHNSDHHVHSGQRTGSRSWNDCCAWLDFDYIQRRLTATCRQWRLNRGRGGDRWNNNNNNNNNLDNFYGAVPRTQPIQERRTCWGTSMSVGTYILLSPVLL